MTREVESTGMVRIDKETRFYLSNALSGEKVGLREIEPRVWQVDFMQKDLGYFSENKKEFIQKPPAERRALESHV